jgi:hypothetical protein
MRIDVDIETRTNIEIGTNIEIRIDIENERNIDIGRQVTETICPSLFADRLAR